MVEEKKEKVLEEKNSNKDKIKKKEKVSETSEKIVEKKTEGSKEGKVEKKDEKSEKKEVKDDEKNEKTEEKKAEEKKKAVKEVVKKDSAIVNGSSLRISRKYSVAVCKMLRGKTPDKAIEILEEVAKGKRAVPMRAMEVPHQKGKGVSGGKYPKNVVLEIIKLLNQAKANAIVNGVENPFISTIKTNQAPRPYKRNRTQGKRAHVYIELKSKTVKL